MMSQQLPYKMNTAFHVIDRDDVIFNYACMFAKLLACLPNFFFTFTLDAIPTDNDSWSQFLTLR